MNRQHKKRFSTPKERKTFGRDRATPGLRYRVLVCLRYALRAYLKHNVMELESDQRERMILRMRGSV